MQPFSHHAVQLIAEQKLKENIRQAENDRLVKNIRAQHKINMTSRLKILLARFASRLTKRTTVQPTESDLVTAEIYGLSPTELRRQEATRLLYERIMQGNALVETEYLDNKIRQGRS